MKVLRFLVFLDESFQQRCNAVVQSNLARAVRRFKPCWRKQHFKQVNKPTLQVYTMMDFDLTYFAPLA